jgi:hypothetical protein
MFAGWPQRAAECRFLMPIGKRIRHSIDVVGVHRF